MSYCPDCGSRMYEGRCTWCHEELYIYEECLEYGVPVSEEFLEVVHRKEVEVSHYMERDDVQRELNSGEGSC